MQYSARFGKKVIPLQQRNEKDKTNERKRQYSHYPDLQREGER